jgi:hypothetical protein
MKPPRLPTLNLSGLRRMLNPMRSLNLLFSFNYFTSVPFRSHFSRLVMAA